MASKLEAVRKYVGMSASCGKRVLVPEHWPTGIPVTVSPRTPEYIAEAREKVARIVFKAVLVCAPETQSTNDLYRLHGKSIEEETDAILKALGITEE